MTRSAMPCGYYTTRCRDLPGFADIGPTPQTLFDTEIAARMLGLHRFGLAAVTEHYLGVTLAKRAFRR